MKKIFLLLFYLFLAGSAQATLATWNNWLGFPLLNETWQYDSRWQLPGDDTIRSTYLRNTNLCGLPAQELKFHLDQNKIKFIEIVFSNKGDVASHAHRQIFQARKKLRDDLNQMAGKASIERIGPARFKTNAEVWKTDDAVFALEADAGDYVILHIYPPDQMPQPEASYDVRKKIKELDLASRVQRNSFGDVYLVVPQVDQGGKGYCVPATFSRVLRYYGIDSLGMHQLAALFKSDRDDGTAIRDAYKKISPPLRSVGISVRKTGDIAMPAIQKAIDEGSPIIWSLYADPKYEDIRRRNTHQRGGAPKEWRRNRIIKSRAPSVSRENCAHMCLIVGYNLLTDEIAVSNSWASEIDGKPTWVPFRVAKKYSMGESFLCEP